MESETENKLSMGNYSWKQVIPNVLTTFATIMAIAGGYLTIKSFDKSYELETSTAKVKAEAISELDKKTADSYRRRIAEIRKTILDLEQKIDQIDPEKIQKDKTSGVILSGNNLTLSKDVQNGLELLNKELFRLPPELAIPVNVARSELFNRFQKKVFERHFPQNGNSVQETNPFYVREFDLSTNARLKAVLNER